MVMVLEAEQKAGRVMLHSHSLPDTLSVLFRLPCPTFMDRHV